MPSAKHPSPLTLRLSPDEWATLKRDAANSELNTSEYVRARLFDGKATLKRHRRHSPIKDRQSIAQIMGLLGKTHIPGNLNQIAKAVNAGYLELNPEVTSAIFQACAHIEDIRQHLFAALGVKRADD